MQHAVTNRVPLPIEQLEEILSARAVPEFTGTVHVQVRVLATAALEVEFNAEVTINHQLAKSDDERKPVITNDRVNKVRQAVRENAHRFTIGTRVTGVEASFVAGELRSFKIKEFEPHGEHAAAATHRY